MLDKAQYRELTVVKREDANVWFARVCLGDDEHTVAIIEANEPHTELVTGYFWNMRLMYNDDGELRKPDTLNKYLPTSGLENTSDFVFVIGKVYTALTQNLD